MSTDLLGFELPSVLLFCLLGSMVDTGILLNYVKSPSLESSMTFSGLVSCYDLFTDKSVHDFMTFIPDLTLTELREV